MGDGNCLFRAISYIIHGYQDSHPQIRRLLADFMSLNPCIFQCLVWEGSVEDHVCKMKANGVWGTHVELAAAATYYRVPVFVCTPHPKTQHYYWVHFNPLPGNLSRPNIGDGDGVSHKIHLSHIELCNTSAVHYDCVLSADNTFPTDCPQLNGC